MNVLDEIAAERARQIEAEGWTPDHDDTHVHGEMAAAAAAYAANASGRSDLDVSAFLWPWDWAWWKPKDRRRDLIRAAALAVAEIERLDRAEPRT
jgi:hypothetical protein